jgi:hypothetical protein
MPRPKPLSFMRIEQLRPSLLIPMPRAEQKVQRPLTRVLSAGVV